MTQPARGLDSGFGDPGADAAPLAGYLDAAAALEPVARWKRASLDALGLRPGHEALDVGSGTGEEVRAMAGRVAPGGRAVGVDLNDGLVAEARARTPDGVPAAFLCADAMDLPFADARFDAVRTERMLQHATDPGAAVAELARVVRPGGAIVGAEPDYDAFVVDAPSLALARWLQRGLW